VRHAQQQLGSEGSPFDDKMPVGIMLEVPSAAMAIDQLAPVVDFFSIGTNDLAQYFFAADRGNARVAPLCDPLEPSFLALLAMIVERARRHGRWIGICGEMAGEIANLPLMLGLAPDEISVFPARVLELKAALATLDASSSRALVAKLLLLRDAGEVRTMLAQMAVAGGSSPLVEPALVDVLSDARTKVEALRELVGLIVASGRARDALALEEAVWAREDTYSTGLGFGFAIPHCKSAAVLTPTIAVAKFQSPIDWSAADGEPVSIALLLAIPEAGTAAEAARTHMRILATLARKLMHEDFRAALQQAATPEAFVDVLAGSLYS
jgi:fructose-specific PTS system IIA-like component